MRVPILTLANGARLLDSNAILAAFYSDQPESPLIPKSKEEMVTMYYWTGVAVGISEMAVSWFIEKLKNEKCSQAVLDDFEAMARGGVTEFDKFIGSRWTITTGLSQADLDMATALDYMSLRLPWDWRKENKNAARYLAAFSERPSFKKTAPPPA
jgi:glutathione S-transferase